MSHLNQYQHLKIPLEAIKSATNNFSNDSCIGGGGFGNVYNGEINHSLWEKMVALKRLDRKFGQGDPEFFMMLSLYKHENIVSLLGYCDDCDEKILVYEYAYNKSLELHIKNAKLTWVQRLEICIGAARGLAYLHDGGGTQQRVLHRDIKSSNILLDENWKAKISDGLSKFGPANQQNTFLYSHPAGTLGYCDPLYIETGLLTKESDVYSFGVMLYEVLCGRLCIDKNYRPLVGLVRDSYEQGTIHEIIYREIKDEVNPSSLETFTTIAYQCLKRTREERPLMTEIVKALEFALQYQDPHNASMQMRDIEVEERPQKPLNEKQNEYEEILIGCIAHDLGFSKGRPVAACVIYKCLIQWRSFKVEKTSIFDRIIQTIGEAIEITQDNNDVLAYWLSNASTLLLLLQRTLKASGSTGAPTHRKNKSATLFGRMSQGFRDSFHGTPQGVNISSIEDETSGTLQQVEAKYSASALLFKQQLTAFVEKIYEMIRDNLKKQISPLLGLCIQAPRTARTLRARAVSKDIVSHDILIAHWQEIVKNIRCFLKILKSNNVPPFLVRKIFMQIFSFINVQLFNSLLLRRECCSFNNGEYIKAGLSELEQWCYKETEEYAGSAWDELKHIRQAIEFLVIHQKPKMTLDEIRYDLCPVISIQQLYRISTLYWDDKYGTHSVSPEVISSMRVLMTEDSNNALSSAFLLDDKSSIPFSVDDLSESMDEINIADVEPPALVWKKPQD